MTFSKVFTPPNPTIDKEKLMYTIHDVSKENLYRNILDIEGPKHPVDDYSALEATGDYIIKKLQGYGLEVSQQVFNVEGIDHTYRNIICRLGNPNQAPTLIGSHYDTVRHSPGANDNGSSVSLALELARILSQEKNPQALLIVFFTLEEGHPGFMAARDRALMDAGIIDQHYRFTSAKGLETSKAVSKALNFLRQEGLSTLQGLQRLLDQGEPEKLEYLHLLKACHEEYISYSPIDRASYTVGSFKFMDYLAHENIQVKQALVFDGLGWIRDSDHSQKKIPLTDTLLSFSKFYKIPHEPKVGNFISLMGDHNSSQLLTTYLKTFEACEIPYFSLDLPFDYETIKQNAPDTLRSDHAAFWRAGIPALFIADMANFRSHYYHTAEDRYCHIDYDMLVKITQSTLRFLGQSSK